MTALVPTICLWIPYVLETTLPRNATLGGYYNSGKTRTAYHVYVARTWDDGELVQVYQDHEGSVCAIDFRRGTSKPIQGVGVSNNSCELLTCNTELGELRWFKYDPKMDLENCITYGKAQSGEMGYVGRTFAKVRTDSAKYGNVPGFFLPSEGFITVWLYGLHHSTDVELLCVK